MRRQHRRGLSALARQTSAVKCVRPTRAFMTGASKLTTRSPQDRPHPFRLRLLLPRAPVPGRLPFSLDILPHPAHVDT